MLAKSKLNSIETLTCQAFIDLDISHEEFMRILKEKDQYKKMKENLRRYKSMKLSSFFFSGYNIKSEILLSICIIKKIFFY